MEAKRELSGVMEMASLQEYVYLLQLIKLYFVYFIIYINYISIKFIFKTGICPIVTSSPLRNE